MLSDLMAAIKKLEMAEKMVKDGVWNAVTGEIYTLEEAAKFIDSFFRNINPE